MENEQLKSGLQTYFENTHHSGQVTLEICICLDWFFTSPKTALLKDTLQTHVFRYYIIIGKTNSKAKLDVNSTI